MATPMEYIVFEPDQVLTNDHLNETFNYLDQQNRWTRNKLIGIGIVCGLEIVQNPGIIEITKGCGVTSQGYLITQDDTLYTYYMPYTPVDVPTDLPFVYDKGDLPFYKPFCAGKTLWLLLSDDQFNVLEPAQQLNAKTLSSAASNFFGDYVVALFLETKESDLKNCDTQDCNNKGEKMVFQVKPLLVAKNDLYGNTSSNTVIRGDVLRKDIRVNVNPVRLNPVLRPTLTPTAAQAQAPYIQLKRFNVPYADLNDANPIIDAFVNLVDDATLNQVADAYNYCYQTYRTTLNVGPNPFADMANVLMKCRDLILQQSPLFIEYFYDFIDDLIKAYNEFLAKISEVITTCCPDENLFPLHLVLGDASLATNIYVKDSYRNYFMYSPLFSKMGMNIAEVTLLFNRMVLLLNDFTVQSKDLLAQSTIKITPSRYESAWLSERAIPYYYKINVAGAELYKSWNYHKTNHGMADFNLSYNSGLYSKAPQVTQPLLYDIEKYDFFRVEGHIGQNYQDVLSNILTQRLTYNLPFDVVAVSAYTGLHHTQIGIEDIDIHDLNLDYDLILQETQSKLVNTFVFIATLPFTVVTIPTRNFPGEVLMPTDAPPKIFTEFKANTIRSSKSLKPRSIDNYYKKGYFMNGHCDPQPNTLGSVYLAALDATTGVFTNPITNPQTDSVAELYDVFFKFLDAVESMLYELNTNDMTSYRSSQIDQSVETYLDSLTSVIKVLRGSALFKDPSTRDAAIVSLIEEYGKDILIEDFNALYDISIQERLSVLYEEIRDRLQQRANELSFITYFKNHPGLEHKGGVPKGGTLVLVYNERDLSFAAKNTANKAAMASNANLKLSADLDANTMDQFTRIVTNSKDVSDAEKSRLINILAGRGRMDDEPGYYEIDNYAVIADFYLPYLCPPINHDIEMLPPPVQNPIISMGGNDTFCENDTNATAITVSIPGGTFNEVPGLDADKQTFTPSEAGVGSYTITYTLDNGGSDSYGINVIPVPKAMGFTFKNEAIKSNMVSASFIPEVQDTGYSYNWSFNNQALKYKVDGHGIASVTADCSNGEIYVNVTLSLTNQICSSPVTQVLELAANAKQGFYRLVADDPAPGGGVDRIKKPGAIEKIFTRKKKG